MPALKRKKAININLLPEEAFEKTFFGRFLKWALSVGRYIVVFTELIVILAFLSRFKIDRDLTDLHESIEQKRAIIASAIELENELRSLNDNFLKIKEIKANQKSYASFIKSFAQLVPTGITIENFYLKENSLSISCFGDTPESLGAFIYQLKLSPKINNIAVENVARKNFEPIKFSLLITLTSEAFKE